MATCNVKRASYIKLINVPSMCDISGALSDPTDGALNVSIIDQTSLNLISKFVQKTKLAGELSHAGHGEGLTTGSSAANGNYYYDDGSQASDGEGDGNQRRGLDHNGVEAASMNRAAQASSLASRINHPSSAIN